MEKGARIFQHYLKRNLDRNSELTAIARGDTSMSYRQLQALSNRITRVLLNRKIAVGAHIGIMMGDKVNVILSILGILNARCVFVFLDPTLPEERIKGMINRVDIELLLRDEAIEFRIPGNISTLCIEELLQEYEGMDGGLPEIPYDPEDAIYIYFTSGTSGMPKAILGKNKSLQHFIEWEIEAFGFTGGSRFSQLVHPGFDAFLRDMFTPLCCGGTICMPEEKDISEGAGALCRWLDRSEINAVHTVPSLFRMICLYHDLQKSMFRNLNWVILSGEKIEISVLSHWYDVIGERTKIVNFYGSTETTMVKAFHIIGKDDLERVRIPVGKPIKGARILILDQRMKACPPLVPGEIFIRTPYATHGYYKEDELNQRLSIPNPLSGNPADRVFRTGDMGRFLQDGTIDLLGRIDRQIKLRGIRVELEEIEAVMKGCPGIDQVVADVREIGLNNRLLCAYITSRNGGGEDLTARLRAFCSLRLPEVMVPDHILLLDEIPLNSNGKINYSALPGPLEELALEIEAPQTDVERKLYTIWAKVLGIENFGVTQSFFRLGGNSLSVLSLLSFIHQEFDRELSVNELFQKNTIRQQTVLLGNGASDCFQPIPAVEEKNFYPLSPAQERMFVVFQMDPSSLAYNIPMACKIIGELDETRLHDVFNRLIQRHQCLRTSFAKSNEGVVQRIRPSVDWRIEGDDTIRPFDLESPPLIRVAVRKIGEAEHLLFVDMHHIVADGISMAVLMKEFAQLYRGETLPEHRIDYKDYALWRCSSPQKEIIDMQKEFWIKQLAGELPRLNLPLDYPRPGVRSFSGDVIKIQFGSDEASELQLFSANEELTLHMIFLSIYVILLSKLSGQEDIVISTPVSGRRHPELHAMVGMFVNTLVLRFFPGGDCPVRNFLHTVKSTTLAALDHQDVSLEVLLDDVEFNVCFVTQNMRIPELDIPGLRLEARHLKRKTSKFDLTMRVEERDDGLLAYLEYCTRLFDESTIRRWAGYIRRIAKAVLRQPDIRLREIEIMEEAEKEWLLHELNDTAAGYPRAETIQSLFQRQASEWEHAVALVGPGSPGYEGDDMTQLAYGQLNLDANAVARRLRERGTGAGCIVALILDRHVDMMMAILGVLKAGGVYLPLDPSLPKERIDYMLTDSGARVVISNKCVSAADEIDDCLLLSMEDRVAAGEDALDPASASIANDPAYVIYTSGTTGKPKGVMIEHRNVVRLLFNDRDLFDFSERDVWTMFHSYCFDFSVWEMYGALLKGGKLVMVPQMTARDSGSFLALLRRQSVTILNQTPSAFYSLAAEIVRRPDAGLPVRMVIFGGEALQPARLKEWALRYPQARLVNMYGITETTVHVTYKEIGPEEIAGNVSNIGGPIPTLSCYALDRHGDLCPTGVTGELTVGGDGVGRGYLNRPELTHEKFVTLDHISPASRLYRSGDLARVLANGDMEYLGRSDHQVKIRGFRIELGEIESRLLSHEDIKEAIVLARANGGSELSLCAYYVPRPDSCLQDAPAVLREYLRSCLPEYMVPSYFVELAEIPLTGNGKVDRRSLPAPGAPKTKASLRPRNRVEHILAGIWGAVLNMDADQVGIDDNFFDLGGHSLKATLAVQRIYKELGVEIALREMFRTPTIRDIAALIGIEEGSAGNREIEPVEKRDYYPVSSSQERMYILHKIKGDDTSDNTPQVLEIEGELDIPRFDAAVRNLVNRHEALRTSFHSLDGVPAQRIRSAVELEIPLREAGVEEIDTIIRRFIRPFDLSCAPLLRVELIRIQKQRHILLYDIHHIVRDGTSTEIFFEEFIRLYNGRPLPELPIQYKDFAVWHQRKIDCGEIASQEEYWLAVFDGPLPELDLPIDFPRPETQSFEGRTKRFALNESLSGAVLSLASKTGCTLFMVLLAAYNILLGKYSGQEDVVVGTPVAGRPHADLQHVIGMFVNTLALRNYPAPEKSFARFLDEVRLHCIEAFENQDLPFDHLVNRLGIEHDPARQPLFDTMFVVQNMNRQRDGADTGIGGIVLKSYAFEDHVAQFDMITHVFERGGKIDFKMLYCTKLFKPETIDSVVERFVEILEIVSSRPDTLIRDIDVTDGFCRQEIELPEAEFVF